MRAVDHYVSAEDLLAFDGRDPLSVPEDERRVIFACATVHATLALAGATALQAYTDGSESELEDWQVAAGGDG